MEVLLSNIYKYCLFTFLNNSTSLLNGGKTEAKCLNTAVCLSHCGVWMMYVIYFNCAICVVFILYCV